LFGSRLDLGRFGKGRGRRLGRGRNRSRPLRHRLRGGGRGSRHLNGGPRLQGGHVDLLGDLAFVRLGLGEFGERFHQRRDDGRRLGRLRGRRQEAAGQQHDESHAGDVEQYRGYACDPRAAAGRGVAPLGQKVRCDVIQWWPYGFHPSTKVLETTSECSLILSRIAKATANVRRAVTPEDFGKLREARESRNASNWSLSGSPLVTGACSKPICLVPLTLKTARSWRA